MLAYAESRQRIGERGSSPSTMLFIVGAHVAVIALAMSMKMVFDERTSKPPIVVEFPEKLPLPPPEAEKKVRNPTESAIDRTEVIIPIERTGPEVDRGPVAPFPPDRIDGDEIVIPEVLPVRPIMPDPVRTGPRLNTPESALKPPYPSSKLDSQEEASLRLQLSIDERGRVTAVAPVGSVDRAFFEAARRHLIARWRYKPATVDGNPVASSTVITLKFQLEG